MERNPTVSNIKVTENVNITVVQNVLKEQLDFVLLMAEAVDVPILGVIKVPGIKVFVQHMAEGKGAPILSALNQQLVDYFVLPMVAESDVALKVVTRQLKRPQNFALHMVVDENVQCLIAKKSPEEKPSFAQVMEEVSFVGWKDVPELLFAVVSFVENMD